MLLYRYSFRVHLAINVSFGLGFVVNTNALLFFFCSYPDRQTRLFLVSLLPFIIRIACIIIFASLVVSVNGCCAKPGWLVGIVIKLTAWNNACTGFFKGLKPHKTNRFPSLDRPNFKKKIKEKKFLLLLPTPYSWVFPNRTYLQSHTSTLVQGGGGWWTPLGFRYVTIFCKSFHFRRKSVMCSTRWGTYYGLPHRWGACDVIQDGQHFGHHLVFDRKQEIVKNVKNWKF